MRLRFLALSVAVAASCVAGTAMGQTLQAPRGLEVPYYFDTGNLANPSANPALVFSTLVEVDNAAWLRLFFDKDSVLGKGSTIRLTSVQDGEFQELDDTDFKMWSHSSIYFNGQAVQVDVYAGPNTAKNQIVLRSLLLEYHNMSHGQGSCGICGADDRFPSDEKWAARLVQVGCSGSIYNEDSCMVSAGHCANNGEVAQFCVPASDSDCSLNHPPAADQFPITSFLFDNNGVGDDWQAMTVGTNNQGQRPFDRYGVLRPIATSVANSGDNVNVWGYGIDSQCTRSQVQQDSNGGPITGRFSTWYEFNVDITFGNSGSALIKDDEIIGIVTHCSTNCPDFATRIDNSDFAAAREQLCPDDGGGDICPGQCNDPVNYGRGTPGSGGITPRIRWDSSEGCSYLGNDSFVVDIDRTLGGSQGTLLVGFGGRENDNSAGWTLLVDLIGPPFGIIIPIAYGGAGAGNGSLNLSFAIPNNPFIDGLQVNMQATAFDAGAGAGVAATDGLEFFLCQ